MCHALDSEPPIPALAGAAVDSEDLTLKSKDGTEFAAFVARAEGDSTRGIVIRPDVRGLYRFYEELALRFAEAGVNAVAFDYFGRTAGVSKREADFPFREYVMQTKPDEIAEDVRACVDYLRSPEGGSCTSIFTVGFCFGGSNSWLQAAYGHGLKGAIGFYGRPGPSFVDNSPGPIDRVNEIEAPILALMGGADEGIPQDQVQAWDKALTDAGVEHEVVVYPGAPLSFFDRSYEEHAEAAADAWRRSLDFIEKYA
jgi:carboxymethylenebutenolidase